jgi:hypothetical protein
MSPGYGIMCGIDGLNPRRHTMNRRTFDILVPALYVIAVLIAVLVGDPAGVGGVVTIGAVCVGAYYAALRQNLKRGHKA